MMSFSDPRNIAWAAVGDSGKQGCSRRFTTPINVRCIDTLQRASHQPGTGVFIFLSLYVHSAWY
jgi:hypothetical protein